MKYFHEIQTPGPLQELSWCNVYFDNLLLESLLFRSGQFQRLSQLPVVTYREFSLTWPASLQIYWNKEFVCIRKGVNSQRTALQHQHCRRDVMWKRSCNRPSDVVVDHLTLPTRFKVCTRKEENVLPKYPKIPQKSLRIISSHDFNSSNHPIELNEDDRRVFMELNKSKSHFQNRA